MVKPSAKRPKAVQAWAVLVGGFTILTAHVDRESAKTERMRWGKGWRGPIVRVRIVPAKPKRRAKAAGGKK